LGSEPAATKLIGPSVGSGAWTPEQVWDTGFIPTYSGNLAALSVERYPADNCFALYGIGTKIDYQTEFANYLVHSASQTFVQPFLNSTSIAQQANKPFIMFETNTASCGGFPGISNSFGAALWALDYGFQMAYSNFTSALLHVGGQNDYYNPFTPPPTNQSTFHQWTIGPVYYSTLIIAEAVGKSNQSQVIDINANGGNTYTPGYAIYDGGSLSKVALFNFMTDPSGANTYTANITVTGATPSSVQVKYFLAPSVAEHSNITWAGQTFGGLFASDGRIAGSMQVQTVNCDTTANNCPITVPAPGFALVFLTSDPETNPSNQPHTFSTTSMTKVANTVTVDPSVLATSNGSNGKVLQKMGSTSQGSVQSNNAAAASVRPSVFALILAAVAFTLTLNRGLARIH